MKPVGSAEKGQRLLRVFYEKACCVKANVVASPAPGRHPPRTTLLSALMARCCVYRCMLVSVVPG